MVYKPKRRSLTVDRSDEAYPIGFYTLFVEPVRGLECAGFLVPLGEQFGVPNCRFCPDRIGATHANVPWGKWGHGYLNPADPADASQPNPALYSQVCEFCYYFSALQEDVRTELIGRRGLS